MPRKSKKDKKDAKRAGQEAKQAKRRRDKARKKERGKRGIQWESEYSKFTAQLEKVNLIVRDIKPDGNCLFRAVSDQLTGLQTGHKLYREECVYEYQSNPEAYAPFLVDETLEDYIEKVAKDGEWGGNLELIALSRRLHLDIIVHQFNRPRFEIHYEGSPIQTIHISYHEGDHYNSIRRSDDDKESRAAIITATPTLRDVSNKKEVEIVSQQTGCKNRNYISECLTMFEGDMDSTVLFMMEDPSSWPVALESEIVEESVEKKTLPKPRKFNRKGPCPCGSGKKFKKCCAHSSNFGGKKKVVSTKKLSNRDRKRLQREKKLEGRKMTSSRRSPSSDNLKENEQKEAELLGSIAI